MRIVARAIQVVALLIFLATNVSAAKVYKNRISPNWAKDGSHMWYRNDLAKGAKEYVLVDLQKGTREPAFARDKLATALVENGLKGVQAVWFYPNHRILLPEPSCPNGVIMARKSPLYSVKRPFSQGRKARLKLQEITTLYQSKG